MIKGKLTASLNPPYVALFSGERDYSRHDCSADDLRKLLVALNAIGPKDTWGPEEMFFSITGEFPRSSLEELGLLQKAS